MRRFLFAANERVGRAHNVVTFCRQRSHRWEMLLKSGANELLKTYWLIEIAQSEVTDVGEAYALYLGTSLRRVVGNQHLATVGGTRNPRRLTCCKRHVVAAERGGQPAVDSHADANHAVQWPGFELKQPLALGASADRVCRITKGHKEAIALSADFRSTPVQPCLPEYVTVALL